MIWAADAPPAAGGSWVQTLITVIGLLGGAGGIAALAATLLQRRKIRADAADVITDTALTLVAPLRERVAELETEAAGARREATAARMQAEQANVEMSDLRTVVQELTGMLTRWRDEVLATAGAPDAEAALARLRIMVSAAHHHNGNVPPS
ncbi:hypothetical protein [Micromonospora costi]|uniref:Uncharacterized protein n=1 Tax=Micromonospora costi TaxID=1530042 RepID=A0A3B0A6F8_9ACTN|nr:hypothetical protein [Micromonospora costi]RKN55963.1 hypothetical protein D7193_15365 [Micromonospora costi]